MHQEILCLPENPKARKERATMTIIFILLLHIFF